MFESQTSGGPKLAIMLHISQANKISDSLDYSPLVFFIFLSLRLRPMRDLIGFAPMEGDALSVFGLVGCRGSDKRRFFLGCSSESSLLLVGRD